MLSILQWTRLFFYSAMLNCQRFWVPLFRTAALHLGQQRFDYLETVADDHNVDAIFRCSVDTFATLAIDIVKERRKCGICVQM